MAQDDRIPVEFDLLREHLRRREYDSAREVAVQLLSIPTLDAELRYFVLIYLARLSTDRQSAFKYLHLAYAADPRRREALSELALQSIRANAKEVAVAYAQAMRALPKPPDIRLGKEGRIYKDRAIEIEAMAYRACGREELANQCQEEWFRDHGGMISLLHATRGRPSMALKTRDLWLDLAHEPDAIEHIFVFDDDDRESHKLRLHRHLTIPAGGGAVRAWNAAAAMSSGKVLIQLSDDWSPPRHWDRLVLESIGDVSSSKVLAVSDGGRTDSLMCMAILTRERLLQQGGWLFHPSFQSVYSDDYFTHCALRDGVVVEARHLVFQHNHPTYGAGAWDKTYAESNSPERYARGKRLLEQLLDEEARLRHNHAVSGYIGV